MIFKSGFKWLTKRVQSFDVYGRTITFTYKGHDQYNTFVGGVTSIVIMSIIFVYAVNLFTVMINRKDTNSTVNTVINDLSQDNNPLYLANSTFQLAISIEGDLDGDSYYFLENDSLFSMSIETHYEERNRSVDIGTPVEYSVCGDNGFKFNFADSGLQSEVSTKYVCPKIDNFTLSGDNYSSKYQYVEIKFKKCENSSESDIVCQSKEAIDQASQSLYATIYIVNAYFDFNEYDEPIRNYLQDGLEYDLFNDFTSNVKLYFQENQVNSQDSYLSVTSEGQESSFISLADSRSTIRPTNESEIMRINFLKSNQHTTIERSVFTLLDLLGILGGIFGALTAGGGLIINIISDRLFHYSILSDLYQVDTMKCQIDHQNSLPDRIKKNNTKFNNQKIEEEKSKTAIASIINDRLASHRFYQASLNLRNGYKNDFIRKAHQSIEHRKAYNYKTKDMCYSLL